MKRWFIIRHIRALLAERAVKRHYDEYAKLGMLPVHIDKDLAVIQDIWDGKA